jgi:NADH-quinone oxidoreductase subunit H
MAPGVIGTDLNIGIFYVMAVGSFGILGILMAGWSSNNKYALLGAFRAVAQLVSYEVPLVVSLITVAVVAGSMSTITIVENQAWAKGGWYILAMPLTFLIFFLASMAEVGRSPFDLLEADSEIVAGFHVEYSGMKYAMFMIGEYVHMLAVAMLSAVLFLGGWDGPFVNLAYQAFPLLGGLLGFTYFVIKTFLFIFIMMWFRGTLPRFRIDQLLNFGWKFLTPLSLFNLLVTAFVVKLFQPASSVGVVIPAGPLANFGGIGEAVALLLSNLLIAFLTSLVIRSIARRSQARGLRAVAAVES